ncbi:predicted protein [Nematostella vectensis]|uniref:Ig-like domain-containing protein n=1 Tax=Nematostella vectensis TaxID=45351 RepID=A7RUN4_NEMVE|nr:predicted protein [Nematostella vectensis]|eukprot:XP_001636837.1 predicted protein [Nematostella vectensis]
MQEYAEIHCNATAKPDPHEYLIYKNGSLVASGNTTYGHVVRLPDAGAFNFTCVPNNTVGTGNVASVLVQVKEKPPIHTNLAANPQTSCVDDVITLTCAVSPASNITSYAFYKNNTLLGTTSSRSYITTATSPGHVLYTCTPSISGDRHVLNGSAVVHVKAPPVVSLPVQNLTIREGENFNLGCSAHGSEPLDIRWLIAGANSTGNLTFTPIKQHQNGFLNGVAKATITCQASGNPRPSITWSGLDFIEDVIFVNKTSVLSRITVATLTARTFVCHARNALGDEKGYITLVTQGESLEVSHVSGILKRKEVESHNLQNISAPCNIDGSVESHNLQNIRNPIPSAPTSYVSQATSLSGIDTVQLTTDPRSTTTIRPLSERRSSEPTLPSYIEERDSGYLEPKVTLYEELPWELPSYRNVEYELLERIGTMRSDASAQSQAAGPFITVFANFLQGSSRVSRKRWIELHPKFQEIKAHGLNDGATRATMLVYLDLCEAKYWREVEIHSCEKLKIFYITGKPKKNQDLEVIVPVNATLSLSMQQMKNLVEGVNVSGQSQDERNKVATLAICDSDSSIVYYKLFSGLEQPDPPTEEKVIEGAVKPKRRRKR